MKYYEMPYRCMVPKAVPNLLVAGRPVCATHHAAAAIRVMPTCFAWGEAAGIAASLALEKQIPCAQIGYEQLRSALKSAGAYVEPDF